MDVLPVEKVCNIDISGAKTDWMIEDLWLDQSVGLIGGEPKSFKTFAALSVAVATASGKECFDRYRVHKKGPVLVYAAEDSLARVRKRIEGIAAAMGVKFEELDIYLITTPKLLIDCDIDRSMLREVVIDIKPVLLILDPFVRLHQIDENSSSEVANVLSWLRDIQRQHKVNILMVHHARKRSGKERPGQSLRGSSELHAWGDSNLYLRRIVDKENYVQLTTEHRSAPSCNNIRLRLQIMGESPVLFYEGEDDQPQPEKHPFHERILAGLEELKKPVSGEELRKTCRIKASTFWTTL